MTHIRFGVMNMVSVALRTLGDKFCLPCDNGSDLPASITPLTSDVEPHYSQLHVSRELEEAWMAHVVTQRSPKVRKVYFYRVADIHDLWHGVATPKFDHKLLAADMRALDGDSQYGLGNDEYQLCLIASADDAYQFGKVRTEDSSQVISNGRVKPLSLPRGERLFDYVHIVFFPSGIVGAEFSLVGPKMSALTDYLVSKLSSCTPVAFERLIHGDVMERLRRVREIKLINIRVATSRSEVLGPFGENAHWTDVAKSLEANLNADSLEITLRAGIKTSKPLNERALSAIKSMFSGHSIREATDKFNITAVMEGSSDAIPIDLLEDTLVANVEIPWHIYRNTDRRREFMYDEIRKAYAGLKQDITQAARITRG